MKIDLNKIGLLPDIYVYFILLGELYCQSNKMFAAINSFWYQDVSAFCLDTAQKFIESFFCGRSFLRALLSMDYLHSLWGWRISF